jgi:hypothetical protein
VSPCALLGTSRLPCQSLCSVAQRLPCSVPACRAAAVLLPAGHRRAPFSHSPATLPVRLPCHGAGLPATLPSGGLASTLPARWAVPPSLPARCDDASLLRAGLLQCCCLLAAGVHTLLPSLRQSASHADVPRCRATGHPALRALASTLPARCLPPSLLDASLLDRLECSTPRPCWPAPYSARRCQSAVGALPIPAPDSSALCDGAGYCLAS